MLNIDIPIALGIIVMFVRSVIDITFDYGQGFFDSLTGLVFFMLLGKLFQQKTYDFLSFERDFKSYFPIAVTKINQNGEEEPCQIYDVEKGDRLIIRNQELIPVDGILISPKTALDYSFVTGEAIPIEKKSGDKVFAGGKQIGGIIEMEVLFSVSQSYLTQLWSNDVFQKKIEQKHKSITDKVSQYFTPALLFLAFGSLIFWLFINAYLAFNVFTAVLIVACPCALALTAPFTLGNVLRIMGNHKLYLKNAQVIEQIAKVDTIVFDKTGTITSSLKSNIEYTGTDLSNKELANIKSIVRNSNHPLSRKLYAFLPKSEIVAINSYEEIVGKGMLASVENSTYKIGSLHLMNLELEIEKDKNTKVHIEIDSEYKGYFAFNHQYREGLNTLFNQLDKNNFKTVVLSGDNDGEQEYLQSVLPHNTTLVFHQKPEQKLEYIQKLQNEGKNVMMVGDGLNDAGALAQSNVGIALSENVNVFSPACDGIMDASQFQKLFHYIQYSKNAMKTIYMSFGLSLLYNSVGLAFALTGKLSPLFAAIIMPMSAITIVSFVTILSKFYGKKIKS
jgi:Cu+-exporting ATPase